MDVPDPRPYGMLNAGVAWVGDTDVYNYECQLIIDRVRSIGWTADGYGMQKLQIWNGESFVDNVMVNDEIKVDYTTKLKQEML